MCKDSDLKNVKLSVLMSVYSKEKSSNIAECFESLLNQTIQADQWVVVKDGVLTKELEEVLSKYDRKYPNLITFVPLEQNRGLGLALREGVQHCRNSLIARMDTDDICAETRFEKQIAAFLEDEVLSICGSYIEEFDGNTKKTLSIRKVPLINEKIKHYQKYRCAFNHMTVMFKKEAVIKAGNYEHAPLMEDDMLWVRMFLINCKAMNIGECLVFARTGIEMITRRGGYSYFKKYKASRKKIYNTGYISYWNYLYTLGIQFIICIIPKKIRLIVFTKLLRN